MLRKSDPQPSQTTILDAATLATQYAEWDLNKTSNTLAETFTALILMA